MYRLAAVRAAFRSPREVSIGVPGVQNLVQFHMWNFSVTCWDYIYRLCSRFMFMDVQIRPIIYYAIDFVARS